MSATSIAGDPLTVDEALAAIEQYLRPGFAKEWRRITRSVGFRTLGKALCYASGTNGHTETVVVSAPSQPAPRKLRSTKAQAPIMDCQGLGSARRCPCAFHWWFLDREQTQRRRMKRHNCDDTCNMTREECMEHVKHQPIRLNGRSFVPYYVPSGRAWRETCETLAKVYGIKLA